MYRRCIAVDETKIKLVGKQLIIWAARDVDTKEVLSFRCSFTRSSLDAELFLKDLLQYCENKPLFLVDKGPWYREAFKSLGLEYEHQTFGMRNRIERWFRILKAKLRSFYNNFPYRSTLHSIKRFLESFIAIYNWVLINGLS